MKKSEIHDQFVVTKSISDFNEEFKIEKLYIPTGDISIITPKGENTWDNPVFLSEIVEHLDDKKWLHKNIPETKGKTKLFRELVKAAVKLKIL